MTSSHRRAYIDWARGIAVLVMIEAHTVDAWTRLNVRRTVAFRDATVLGGFAAPLFLWLAGLAVVLSATRAEEKTGSRRAAVTTICRRGVEIYLLAFLFRLQGWIVTPGGHPVTLFRVDILNIMGPAIAAAGLVWGLARTAPARVCAFVAAATAVAMVSPIARAARAIDALPLFLQWYVRPFAEFSTFTLFPWAAFVFAGGAVGALAAAARDARQERRLQLVLGAIGAAMVVVGFYTAARPSIYAPGSSSFWTSSPTWFAIRLGILMMALTVMYAIETLIAALKRFSFVGRRRPSGRRSAGLKAGPYVNVESVSPAIDPLARLGRNSLFIYWIHVELVYGYASWGWRHRLPLWGTAIGYALFCVLMYRAIGWRDTLVGRWRSRPRGTRPAIEAATA
jgi:uncharacterized membrane protein